MKAVIMAGGEGTRLRPLTCSIPKPMVPIMNKPVMEHIINLLKNFQINDIAVTLFYLPSVIMDYFGNGESQGASLSYYIEETPLGTGGSVLNTNDFIDDTFIVISGDALTDIDLSSAVKFHKDKKSKATLVLKREAIPLEYGVVITDDTGRIKRFMEKPSWGEVFSDTINTGIYILEPSVFDYYRPGDNFDFSRDLFPRLLADNIPMYGYVAEGYWCDIGDLASYKHTHFDILDGKVHLYDKSKSKYGDITIGQDTVISEGAKIVPPVFIGSNCTIKDNVFIDSYTVIGNNCVIDLNTTIKKSILWEKVHLGKNNQCRSTLIADKVLTKNGVNLFEDSVIGESNNLMDNVLVKPNVKIWPGKKISEGACVNSSLVWGAKSIRKIFGNRGISGEVNYEITPEFASLLGSAFASSLKKGSCIIVSSDDSASGHLIKQSVASGVLSSGCKVIDIDNITLPMSRLAVRLYNSNAGIHIFQNSRRSSIIDFEFLNESGGTIDRKSERKIENILLREDFERCSTDTINHPMHIENFFIQYMQYFSEQLKNIQAIRSRSLNILLSSSSELVLKYASMFLESLGCTVNTGKNESCFDSFDSYINYISSEVVSSKSSAGFVLNSSGENIIIIDNKGNVTKADNYVLFTLLVCAKYADEKRIIVPATVSTAAEAIALKYGASVVRSRSGISAAINDTLALYAKGNTMMLQYILNFDGIAAIIKLIDILTANRIEIYSIKKEIPEYHIKNSQIECEFKDMGKVIRLLAESYKNNADLNDGLRINTKKGWALVLPDNEKPVFNIYAEGFSNEYADEISAQLVQKLKSLLNK